MGSLGYCQYRGYLDLCRVVGGYVGGRIGIVGDVVWAILIVTWNAHRSWSWMSYFENLDSGSVRLGYCGSMRTVPVSKERREVAGWKKLWLYWTMNVNVNLR